MIRTVQINMHGDAAAHQLLARFAAEVKVDQTSNTETGTRLLDISDDLGRCLGITFFSVYLTSNETMPDFWRRLDTLEDAVSGTKGRILVGDDFNVRALEWGMPQPVYRGRRSLEMAAGTRLVDSNTESTPMFRRPSREGSNPDITFASEPLAPSVSGWRVLEYFSASVHQYIAFEVVDATC